MHKNLLCRSVLLPLLIVLSGLSSGLFAQAHYKISGQPQTEQLNPDNRLPGISFQWPVEMFPGLEALQADEKITYQIEKPSQSPFTGLAIGWNSNGKPVPAAEFGIKLRSWTNSEPRPGWTRTRGYIEPDDSPSGLYWAMLYVTPDGGAHDHFEIEISAPASSPISYLTVTAADARSDEFNSAGERHLKSAKPGVPEIISRAGWWGNLPPSELEPNYIPQQITITHAAVHHTVTANSPANPAQVVRQIWDWHVNDNGWLDIGYNFIIDHTGNIYQGRYNPWLKTTDVRGAHAGNANSRSVGIALLGQFEPGANPQAGSPEVNALDALVRMISWRFQQREIDPLSFASIPVNPSGTATLPVIFGHRNVSNTACPGENLYTLLPDIRNSVDTEESITEPEPAPFTLGQNFPNPFRESTTIPFTLDEELEIEINLYTVSGRRIGMLFSGTLPEGEHEIPLEMNRELSSGVYYYELKTGIFTTGRAMIYFRQ